MIRRTGRRTRSAVCVAALAIAACDNDPVHPRSAGAAARGARLHTQGVRADSLAHSTRVRCGQPTHVWVRTTGTPHDVIDPGATIWFTGVVVPYTNVDFRMYDAAGALRLQHTTRAAGSNCVIAHEPEARATYGLEPGVYAVYASYYHLDPSGAVIYHLRDRFVQHLRVREPAAPPPPPPPQDCYYSPGDWPPEVPWPGGCFVGVQSSAPIWARTATARPRTSTGRGG
jgi:hypothetical protein